MHRNIRSEAYTTKESNYDEEQQQNVKNYELTSVHAHKQDN